MANISTPADTRSGMVRYTVSGREFVRYPCPWCQERGSVGGRTCQPCRGLGHKGYEVPRYSQRTA